MKFDRWVRVEGSSWALWEFNEYETQMNNMYWSGESSTCYSTFVVSHAPKHVPVKDTLKASGPNATRFPSAADEWLESMADLKNWNRASFVLAATGALERYTQRIVLTALLSDPAVVYGKSKAIDGLCWLKLGINVNHDSIIEGVTKGDWNQRYAAIKKLFGEISMLKHHLGTLDEIREFRNAVGHAFGRDLDGDIITNSRTAPKMLKIKQGQLTKWFGVLSEAAKAIDQTLVVNHIGDFEPLLHFHSWVKEPGRCGARRDPTFVRAYTKVLGRVEGHSKGMEYNAGLIAAYDGA